MTRGSIEDAFGSSGANLEIELDERVSSILGRFLAATSVSTEARLDALSESFLDTGLPDPESISTYLTRLGTTLIDHCVNVSSPHYMGHMTSALPYFVRPLSRLVAGLNQNVVKVETSRAFTCCERQAIGMLHRLVFGCSDAFYAEHVQNGASTLGNVTSGGTVSNMTALWIARNLSLGALGSFPGVERAGLVQASAQHGVGRPVVVGSALMHYSIEKSVDLLGLGATGGLVRVPVDTEGSVRVDVLRRAVEQCRERGDRVVAIVGVAGSTDCGAIDPLADLAAIARETGAHFHVDAAWGGTLLFSEAHRSKLAGIELADSVTIDGHKQLYLPMGLGVLLLRDPHAARAIEKHAQYIIRSDSADLGRRTLEGSRPGAALYLHAALHVLGRETYGHLVDEGIRKTKYLATRIQGHEELELLGTPRMNILNYRYVPAAFRMRGRLTPLSAEDQTAINRCNMLLHERQKLIGRDFVSRTTLSHTHHGGDPPIVALRAVLANPLTAEAHIDAMLEGQIRLGDAL